MVTASAELPQTPFVLVQVKTFAPTARFETPLVGEFGFAIVAPPEVVQVPVPVVIVLPASVAVVAQTD